MALFGRKAIVTIDTLVVDGLDVRFKIHKSETGEPNKGQIDVYNLNETHRVQLEARESVEVALEVGYTEDAIQFELYRGNIRRAFSAYESPDWVSTLTTGDGEKEVAQARVNKSYAQGTKYEVAWRDAVKALEGLGLKAGNAIEKFRDGTFQEGIQEFLSGANLQGQAYPELQRMARSFGLDVSIQNKELVVTEIGQPLGGTPVLLSRSSGLIGSPSRGAKGELKVRALLLPGLDPKHLVEVKSRLVNGIFYIQKGAYSGDLRGNDWYADLECKEVA